MSDVIFVPMSAHGHVNPLLPVLTEVLGRGARARVLVSAEYAPQVAATGAEVLLAPGGFDPFMPDGLSLAGLSRMARGMRDRGRFNKAAAALLTEEIARARPDSVVWDVLTPWARRAAVAQGVPTIAWSTTYTLTEAAFLDGARERFGRPGRALAKASRLGRLHPSSRYPDPVLVNAVPELQPALDSLDRTRVHLVGPLLRVPDRGADPLPWEEIERRPVVLFSPGTVFARGPEFFRAAAEAFDGSDWLVLLSTGATDPARLGVLPPNVIARRTLPQQAVLAHTDVFVTHGGMNSVQEALAEGVPMVVVPRLGDQRGNASRLTERGLAITLVAKPRAAALRASVERVAADAAMRARCERVRDRLAG
ncbi:nucleotide disphospho-sugar-binding domain-containing protein, partial [Crossiella equi]